MLHWVELGLLWLELDQNVSNLDPGQIRAKLWTAQKFVFLKPIVWVLPWFLLLPEFYTISKFVVCFLIYQYTNVISIVVFQDRANQSRVDDLQGHVTQRETHISKLEDDIQKLKMDISRSKEEIEFKAQEIMKVQGEAERRIR